MDERVEEPWGRVIEILTLTSRRFRRQVEDSVPSDVKAAAIQNSFWTIQILRSEKLVRIISPPMTTISYPMDFDELFPEYKRESPSREWKIQCDVRSSAMFAPTQVLMFDNSLSSDPLINFVSNVDDVVHVASAQKPSFPPQADMSAEIWNSDDSPSDQTASGSDVIVYSSSEDEFEAHENAPGSRPL